MKKNLKKCKKSSWHSFSIIAIIKTEVNDNEFQLNELSLTSEIQTNNTNKQYNDTNNTNKSKTNKLL